MSSSNEATAVETAEQNADGLTPAVVASVGSVALALYFYYVRGDKQRGQFVGFWPVTILALASYFKLEEIKQMLAERSEIPGHSVSSFFRFVRTGRILLRGVTDSVRRRLSLGP